MNAATQADTTSDTKAVKRTLSGKVVSNKMNKTVTVLVERKVKHPVYGKFMTRSTKLHAHTEEKIPEGAMVEIRETRPMSRTKNWVVVKVASGGAAV